MHSSSNPPLSAARADAAPAVWTDAGLADVAANLALDEALLEEAHEGLRDRTVVRGWMAGTATVVLGSSSRLAEEVDLEACRRLGVGIVRRPSGGLTVVTGPGCLMWSVITCHPAGPPGVDALHATILEPLCRALTAAGRPVVRRGSSDLATELAGPGLKVSGNALRIRRRASLYHGTLLDDFDLELVGRLLRHPPREPEYRAGRAHEAFLANLNLGRQALETALRTAFGAMPEPILLPHDRVERLVAERYACDAWTHRF